MFSFDTLRRILRDCVGNNTFFLNKKRCILNFICGMFVVYVCVHVNMYVCMGTHAHVCRYQESGRVLQVPKPCSFSIEEF